MTKLPRVVIVGLPNVGKSTLFNRLLGRRKALVHTDPGMTRDSLAAECTLGDRRFTLVDTGGLFGVADEPLSDKVRAKALEEAAAADLVLFVLDGKRGIASAEEELYFQLKRRGLPILLVVNKFDSPAKEESMTAEYYRLGEKGILFVSAEHKINMERLEEAIVAALPAGGRPGGRGRPCASPSSAGPTSANRRSSTGWPARSDSSSARSPARPGTRPTPCSSATASRSASWTRPASAAWPRPKTAGRRPASSGPRSNIRQADVVCLVLDVQEFPTRQDARIAQLALESGRPLIIALNKWDLVDRDTVRPEAVRDRVFRKLGFVSYAPLLFVSARTGQRVVKILDTAEQVYKGATTRVETSKLNEFLARTAETHPPRLKNGARAKLRYITQKSVSPRPSSFSWAPGAPSRRPTRSTSWSPSGRSSVSSAPPSG